MNLTCDTCDAMERAVRLYLINCAALRVEPSNKRNATNLDIAQRDIKEILQRKHNHEYDD
jgi:hypothetical protein